MYRHRVDVFPVQVENSINPLPIIDYASNSLVNLPLYDTLPANSTGVSVDNSRYIIPSSSILFSNGNVSLGLITLGHTWSLEGWFYLTENISPIFSLDSGFSIRYNKTNNQLELGRAISLTKDELRLIPLNLTLNSWLFLSINRTFNKILVYVNFTKVVEIDNYFFTVSAGGGFLGRVDDTNFSGNITSFKLSNSNFYNTLLYRGNLDVLKTPLQLPNSINQGESAKLLQLDDKEYRNNTVLSPIDIKYSYLEDCWKTPITGMRLLPDPSLFLPRIYTLEFFFQIPTNTNTDIVLCSNWYSGGQRYYYFSYVVSTGQIRFVYYRKQDNSIQVRTIGNYVPSVYNHAALQTKSNGFDLYLNGVRSLQITDILETPLTPSFQFNNNLLNIPDYISQFNLKQFIITKGTKYGTYYIPYLSSRPKIEKTSFPYLVKYHLIEQYYRDKSSEFVDFQISGNNSINVNTFVTYTITQLSRYRLPVTYQYYLELVDPDTNITIPNTITSINIEAGSITQTFNIRVQLENVQPYNPKVRLVVVSPWIKKELIIIVQETRSFNLNTITGISGYVDGYLARMSISPGSIPNIIANRTATTSATRVPDSLYGFGFDIDTNSDEIQLPVPLENIRTVVLVYRENVLIANRAYVGDSTSYTFNGGSNGELVGDLVLTDSEYINAIDNIRRIPNVKISAADNLVVAIDETANQVLLYEKQNSGVWNSVPSTLNTDITSSNYLQGASIYINSTGTVFSLGFKNANNGEGVVQVWRKVSGVWAKDLHISSPVPSPSLGAFGYSVAINDAGNRLFVAELGSNRVYIFDKTTIWSNTPTETLIGTDRFGFSLDINNAGTLLAITSPDLQDTYLYRLDTDWTLEQTIPFGEIIDLHRTLDLIAISQITTGQVRLYERDTTWQQIKQFSNGNTDFGFHISLDDNQNLNISDISQRRVYRYEAIANWDNSEFFTDVSAQYGYVFSTNNDTLVISNYNNLLRVTTKNNSAIPQNIVNVRQGFSNVALNTPLNRDNPQILTFQSSVAMTISKIGGGKSNTGLNGIFIGALFYNQLLSNQNLSTLEVFLTRYLRLTEFSVY